MKNGGFFLAYSLTPGPIPTQLGGLMLGLPRTLCLHRSSKPGWSVPQAIVCILPRPRFQSAPQTCAIAARLPLR